MSDTSSLTFGNHTDCPTGNSPAAVAVGDFNADGHLDLAVVNQADNTVSILLGNADGTFASHIDYATGACPISLAVADFHGGGKLDLAVVNQKGNSLSILAGKGDGTFASRVDYITGIAPASVAVADFNRDGRLDLAVAIPNGNTVTVFLTNSVADVEPSSLSFDNQVVGSTSPTQTVTVKNKGSVTLNITSIDSSPEFPQTNSCSTGIAPQASCTVSVSFKPASAGVRSGVLTLSGALMRTATVSLSGTGTAPSVTFLPATVTFDTQVSGTTSAAKPVTLSNKGTAPLTISGISVTAEFGQTSNCGNSVAVGASCTISMTFTPSAAGDRTGTLTVTDNATGSPRTAALQGTGSDFSLGMASGSTSTWTGSAGQSTTYNLNLAPANGFNSQVTFTCTGVPPLDTSYITCVVAPNPATLSGSSATPITVNITTRGAASSVTPQRRFTPPGFGRFGGPWAVAGLAILLAALGWIVWIRDGNSARQRGYTILSRRVVGAGLAGVALLGVLGLTMLACGGGNQTPTPTPSPFTPPGTYALKVTGTTGSGASPLSHDMAITLIVK